METKLRFLNGLLQADSDDPAEPGYTVTDMTFVNGLLDHVETNTIPE